VEYIIFEMVEVLIGKDAFKHSRCRNLQVAVADGAVTTLTTVSTVWVGAATEAPPAFPF